MSIDYFMETRLLYEKENVPHYKIQTSLKQLQESYVLGIINGIN